MGMFSDWTLAELKAARLKLSKALVGGQQSVTFADRNVQWRTVADMRTALGLIEDAIVAAEGTTPAPRRITFATRSGWR